MRPLLKKIALKQNKQKKKEKLQRIRAEKQGADGTGIPRHF